MNSFRAAIQSGKGLHPKDPLVRGKESRCGSADDLESVPIPRVEERSADHRLEDRHRLIAESATAIHKGDRHQVDIVNLSGGGAMIIADFKPRLWDRVDLGFAEGPAIECAVRWLRDDRIGLEFAHETKLECDAETRDALLLDVIRRSFPDIDAIPRRGDDASGDQFRSTDGGKRAEIRHPLIWNGQLHHAHDSHRVRLRNVSAGGALVDVATTYPIDAEVMLDLGDAGQYFATVSWLHGDQAGLKFKEPFDMACLARAKPDVLHAKWERPRHLDLAADGSPWDEQWTRMSLEDIRADLEGYLKH